MDYQQDVQSILNQIEQSYQLPLVADALGLLWKLINNILQNPIEDKFRHIRWTNKALAGRLFNIREINKLLEELGFIKLEDSYYLPLEHLEMLIEYANYVKWQEELMQAKLQGAEQYKKALEVVKQQRATQAEIEKEGKEKEKIQQQLDYDKQERKYIKAKDSVANQLKFGANVKKYQIKVVDDEDERGGVKRLHLAQLIVRTYYQIKLKDFQSFKRIKLMGKRELPQFERWIQ